jgi:gluconokinase
MAESQPLVLALDVGTSGVRAALLEENGDEVSGASVRINSRISGLTDNGIADADLLVEEVARAIDALFAKLRAPVGRVELVAASCFWHSLIGVDEAGRATTPLLGWSDSRAVAAAYKLRSTLDEKRVHARTGCRLHPSYWPAKLERLRHEEPETFRATSRWLSFAEYLTLKFYGESAASVSMASATGLLNTHTCEWDEELTKILDVRVESLPQIASSNQYFHTLNDHYALRWPQLSDVRMLPAPGDGAANNIGAGCVSTEMVALMVGTSGAMRVLFQGEPPVQLPPELWCYRADRSRVVIGGALSDGGGLYNWLRAAFFSNDDTESIETGLARLEPDAHGLTVLPFWLGERSTGWTPDARGAILGLTMQTRPIEILRAAMEAVAYRFALIAEALEPFAPGATIIAAGHALRSSRTWVQILADVLGRRIAISELPEASMRGAALLALEAVGKIESIENVSVSVERFVEPDMTRHSRYQAGLKRQQQMYEQVIRKGFA